MNITFITRKVPLSIKQENKTLYIQVKDLIFDHLLRTSKGKLPILVFFIISVWLDFIFHSILIKGI